MNQFKGSDRFTIQHRLGSGAFGVVYEVFDLERQARVALKAPHDANDLNIFLFKQEYRALAEISHPNLVNLYDLVFQGQTWFFTMELVEGKTFYEYLCPRDTPERRADVNQKSLGRLFAQTAPGNTLAGILLGSESPLPEGPAVSLTPFAPENYDTVRSLLRQLAEGLLALHQNAKLHRNLKPNNVRVTPQGRLALLDFGLHADLGGPGGQASRLTGTPAYMAPEQIGGHAPTEASDWYSVGAMLYQALTGHLPFPGNSLATVVNKMRVDPPSPRTLVPQTPADLDALCLALLRRKPEQRPAGLEILAELGGTLAGVLPRPAQAPRPRESNLLLGRETELAQLAQAFQDSQTGTPVLALVHGGNGAGKSFLLRRFLLDLQREEPRAVILAGRCYEGQSVPFQALGSLLEALADYLQALPVANADSLLPRNSLALARLFPVLQRVEAVASFQGASLAPDPQELRRRAFGALRELLGRLGSRFPLILVLDDLQWGDPDSLALLTTLFQPPDPPPLLLLVSHRTQDGQPAPGLQRLQATLADLGSAVLELPLEEVASAEAAKLATALLGQDFPEVGQAAARIAAQAGGNPFFISVLSRHARAGIETPQGEAAGSLNGYIRTGLAALPAEPRRFLELLALAGHPMGLDLLLAACGCSGDSAEVLGILRAGHLVRTRGPQDHLVDLYHDRIREAVLLDLPATRARALHLKLAEALEACPHPDSQALALHFQAAGELDKAADHALVAAEEAVETFAFERAAHLFQQVLDLRAPRGAEYLELLVRLGDAQAHAGRGAAAAQTYLKAVPGSSARETLRLQRRASEEFIRAGDFAKGITTLGPVLLTHGLKPLTSPGLALLATLWCRTRLRLRGTGIHPRPEPEVAQGDLDRIDLCWAAALGFAAVDPVRCGAFQARQLLLTLEAGEPFRVVRALAQETVRLARRGNHSLAATHDLQARTLTLAEKLGQPGPLSQGLLAAGTAALLQGRWKAGVDLLEQAEALLRDTCTGLDFELHLTQHHALLGHLILGDLREVQVRYPTRLQAAREKGNRVASTNLRIGIAPILLLAQDEPGRALREVQEALADWTAPGFHVQHCSALVSLVTINLYGGNLEGAWELLATRWKPLRRAGFLKVQAFAITCLELRARTALALAGELGPGSGRQKTLLKTAHADIHQLESEATPYGEALALKLQAMEALVLGRPEEAAALYFQAEIAFQACDMALHATVVRHCRGLLEGPSGQDHVAAADWWLRNQGIVHPSRFVAMHIPTTLALPAGLAPLSR